MLLPQLGDLALGQERDLLVMHPQHILSQVNTHLMTLQHIQPKQQIHVLALHDREARRQRIRPDLYLGGVDAAEDLGGANPNGGAAIARVDQAHDAAGLGSGGRHDCGLGAGIDKGFDGDLVDQGVDVEHGDAAEDFGIVFKGLLHIFVHPLQPDHLFDLGLRFQVERVGVEEGELGFLGGLDLGALPLLLLPDGVELFLVVGGGGELGRLSLYLLPQSGVSDYVQS